MMWVMMEYYDLSISQQMKSDITLAESSVRAVVAPARLWMSSLWPGRARRSPHHSASEAQTRMGHSPATTKPGGMLAPCELACGSWPGSAVKCEAGRILPVGCLTLSVVTALVGASALVIEEAGDTLWQICPEMSGGSTGLWTQLHTDEFVLRGEGEEKREKLF